VTSLKLSRKLDKKFKKWRETPSAFGRDGIGKNIHDGKTIEKIQKPVNRGYLTLLFLRMFSNVEQIRYSYYMLILI
jgi:hypothetical protein